MAGARDRRSGPREPLAWIGQRRALAMRMSRERTSRRRSRDEPAELTESHAPHTFASLIRAAPGWAAVSFPSAADSSARPLDDSHGRRTTDARRTHDLHSPASCAPAPLWDRDASGGALLAGDHARCAMALPISDAEQLDVERQRTAARRAMGPRSAAVRAYPATGGWIPAQFTGRRSSRVFADRIQAGC